MCVCVVHFGVLKRMGQNSGRRKDREAGLVVVVAAAAAAIGKAITVNLVYCSR